MDQVKVNLKELEKAAESISNHDHALRNVREEIESVDGQLEEVAAVQEDFAESVREVIQVQASMTRAQEKLSNALDETAAMADDQIGPLLEEFQSQLESFERVANRLGELGTDFEGIDASLQSKIEEARETATAHLKEQLREEVDRLREVMKKEAKAAAWRLGQTADELLEPYRNALSENERRVEQAEENMAAHAEKITESVQAMEQRMASLQEDIKQMKEAAGELSDVDPEEVEENGRSFGGLRQLFGQ